MHEEAQELLKNKKFSALRRLLSDLSPIDVAKLIEEFEVEDLIVLFRLLPKDLAAETFVEMDTDSQEQLINAFNDKELENVVSELYVDDAVDIIEEMPANVVKRILKHTDSETRKNINELLKYPKDSAGSIMNVEYVDLRKDMTVGEAFSRIRKVGVDKETIYTCYVVDKNRFLEGIVTAKDLMISDRNKKLEDIMETNVISVNTLDDEETVAEKISKYDFIAMPVVDKENRLVGIITVDDVIDVIEQETTEDFTKMAAITPSEETYFKTPIWVHAKNRILWLLFLMLSATITGLIIERYEEALKTVTLLAAFLPMLMGTGGNCGAQSSTMIIRGLTLNEINPKNLFKLIFKEFKIAFIIGIILAVVNGIRAIIMNHDAENLPKIIIAEGLTLILTVMLSKILGAVLPIIAKGCKLDPALMASPLITTIVDACSVLIFFSIATSILGVL